MFYFNEYKRYRNSIVNLSRLSKSNYYSEFFRLNIRSAHRIWQGVNEIISTHSSSLSSPISLLVGNSVTSDPNIIANTFNQYFCTIADTIRATIPASQTHFSRYLKKRNPFSFFLDATCKEEVQEHISELSNNKASGPYSIPTKILKILKAFISTPLATLYNLSFSSGCFPSILKTSKVVPVFKKDSPLEASNYRPISLLSNLEKILENLCIHALSVFLITLK